MPTSPEFNAVQHRKIFATDEFASPSKYLIEFDNAPEILRTQGIDGSNSKASVTSDFRTGFLSFAAQTAELPMRQLDTIERRYAGPIRNIPVGHTYSTMNVEFVEDPARKVRSFFVWWQENVFDKLNLFSVPYYDNIVVPQMRVKLFANDGRLVETYIIHEVFPINIGSTQLSWNSTNQIMTTNIEFAFHRWEVENVSSEKSTKKLPTKPKSFLEQLTGTTDGIARNFKKVVDTIRTVKNAKDFVKGSYKTAKQLARNIKNLRKLKVRNLDDLANAAGTIGGTVRATTDSVNKFGTTAVRTQNRLTTDQVNKYFNNKD